MSSSENLINHFEAPRNVGAFPKDDPNVFTGVVGGEGCGDLMKLQIKIDPETQSIVDARFNSNHGCGSAIASSSLATEWLKGKPIDEALTLKKTDLAGELSLPPVQLHCSALVEEAIKRAVEDYQTRGTAKADPSEA